MPPDQRIVSMMEKQTKAHYSAVGRVALYWTRFESEIARTVRMLAGIDNKYGECLTAQVANTARMLDALAALVELRAPGIATQKSFKKHLDNIQGLAERRNRVVHDIWTFDPGKSTRWQTSVRRIHKSEPIEMTTAEVETLASQIDEMSLEFMVFSRELLMKLNLWGGN
jgi:hypothetical protein